MHFITFIHDVRSQCGLCAAHHCFHCFFRCFFTASCFCCFFIASCFRCCCVASCFRCRCLSLAILHGWSRQCIFMLCCFLTLFSVAVRNTLCRNSNLLCRPSFLITAQNVCVCVCTDLALVFLIIAQHDAFTLCQGLHHVPLLQLPCRIITSLRHYVITVHNLLVYGALHFLYFHHHYSEVLFLLSIRRPDLHSVPVCCLLLNVLCWMQCMSAVKHVTELFSPVCALMVTIVRLILM